MSDPQSLRAGLPHAVFLSRIADAAEPSSLEARRGRAAFLALRLVDLLDPDHAALHPDAFHYQHVATERCCRELPAGSTEASHVLGLVRGTADAFREDDVGLVLPALIAYAHYLEDEMRLDEALDVLDTTLAVGRDALHAGDRVAAQLRTARVLRKLNEFDRAEQSYDEAGTLAGAHGDRHSELLSRIGRGYTVTARGNLADAERLLRGVLADAEAAGDQPAQALAHQGVAIVLSTGGRPAEAIPHLWHAFESYEDEISQGRALADLGGLLLIVGDSEGAERALNEAVRRGGTQDFATNALIELMHCASYRHDRIGFERWREECQARRDSMPPNILVDFVFKTAIGRARFGQVARAEALLTDALRMAEAAHLHEFVFRIERIKNGLRDGQCEFETALDPAQPEVGNDAVREVSASLARLGG